MKTLTWMRLLLSALLVTTGAFAQETLPPPAIELEPALDTPAPIEDVNPGKRSPLVKVNELTKPRQAAPADGQTPAKKITVGNQLIRHTNPRALGDAFKDGYGNRRFLSTHGTVHPNPGDAMLHSLSPETTKANTRGAVKGALDPINLVVSFGLPVAQEMVRQYVQDGRIDPRALKKNVRVAAIGGGFAGGVAGTVAGAALQSALAGSLGPFGAVAGFVAKPLLGFAGGMLGARFGENASHGNLSLKDAFKESWKQFDPGRDLGSIVGGTVGAVVGQALIPIPGVGGFVGSMVGTVIGGWVGAKFFHGKKADPRSRVGGVVKGLLGKTSPAAGYTPVESLQRPAVTP